MALRQWSSMATSHYVSPNGRTQHKLQVLSTRIYLKTDQSYRSSYLFIGNTRTRRTWQMMLKGCKQQNPEWKTPQDKQHISLTNKLQMNKMRQLFLPTGPGPMLKKNHLFPQTHTHTEE